MSKENGETANVLTQESAHVAETDVDVSAASTNMNAGKCLQAKTETEEAPERVVKVAVSSENNESAAAPPTGAEGEKSHLEVMGENINLEEPLSMLVLTNEAENGAEEVSLWKIKN